MSSNFARIFRIFSIKLEKQFFVLTDRTPTACRLTTALTTPSMFRCPTTTALTTPSMFRFPTDHYLTMISPLPCHMTTCTVLALSTASTMPFRETLTTLAYGAVLLRMATNQFRSSAAILQQASDLSSRRTYVFESSLRLARKWLRVLTSPRKCVSTSTTMEFSRRLMMVRLMSIVLPRSPMCSALPEIPTATSYMPSTTLSTCPLFSQLTTILTLSDDHFKKHATCSSPLPSFENAVLMLTWHSDTCVKHVTDVLSASPISLRSLLHKPSTRFAKMTNTGSKSRLTTT